MRLRTRLLLLPLAIGLSSRDAAAAQATADSATVTVRWNRLVPRLADEAAAARRASRAAATAARDSAALRRIAETQAPLMMHVYAILSVAQYGAGNSARAARNVSADAAVASASATVLNEFFTDSTVRASIARELARDLEVASAGSRASQRKAGSTLGVDVARRILARAPKLDLATPWNGTIPTGPGMWFSAPGLPPLGIAARTARGWLIDSASQFRPGPPPAYGSPAWQAAMEEVRRVARERSPEQVTIAQKWNIADPSAPWNETAAAAIRRHKLSDADAARVLAVMNVAVSDVIIACFEAKYHYWTIRPSQADTTFKLADKVGLPNFPSFPSGHACSAGAFDAALGHFFPADRAEFTRIAEEQAMSRLYGGIHYRFDNDGGLALGRIVARAVAEREQRGRLNAWIAAAAKP